MTSIYDESDDDVVVIRSRDNTKTPSSLLVVQPQKPKGKFDFTQTTSSESASEVESDGDDDDEFVAQNTQSSPSDSSDSSGSESETTEQPVKRQRRAPAGKNEPAAAKSRAIPNASAKKATDLGSDDEVSLFDDASPPTAKATPKKPTTTTTSQSSKSPAAKKVDVFAMFDDADFELDAPKQAPPRPKPHDPSPSSASTTPAQKNAASTNPTPGKLKLATTAIAPPKKSAPFDPFAQDDDMFSFGAHIQTTPAAPAVSQKVDQKQKVLNLEQDSDFDDLSQSQMKDPRPQSQKQLSQQPLKQSQKDQQSQPTKPKPMSIFDSDDDDNVVVTAKKTAITTATATTTTTTITTTITATTEAASKPQSPAANPMSIYDSEDEVSTATKRKSPPTAQDADKKKAPAKSMSLFDQDDDDDDFFTSSKTSNTTKSTKTKTTKASTAKTSRSTKTSAFDDDNDDFDFSKPSKSTTASVKITTSAANLSDDDLIDAWGEPYFSPDNVSWKPGQQIPYNALTSMFAKCEETTKRLLIISYVRDFFRAVIHNSPEQLLIIVYLCVNQVAPAFEGREMGIGPSIIEKTLCDSIPTQAPTLKQKMTEIGDLGHVAQQLKSRQSTLMKPRTLYCDEVFTKLKSLSMISGKNSQGDKRDVMKGLLSASKNQEIRFLVRAFQGNLRIHLALLSVLRALAEAIVHTPPKYQKQFDSNSNDDTFEFNDDDDDGDDDDGGSSDDDDVDNGEKDGRKAGSAKKAANDKKRKAKKGENSDNEDESFENFQGASKNATPLQKRCQWAHKIIESAYNEGPSFDRLIPVLLEYPLSELKNRCMLTPGLPIKVMLGKPATSISSGIEKLAPNLAPDEEKDLLTWEYKYDGERAQIHLLENGKVQIFSRHMEPYDDKYPDVIANIPKVIQPGTKSFIIDCEVVAWDPVKKRILPFQTLSTRKRKDVTVDNISVKVQMFPFDMLYYNGQSLMKTEFIERRRLLHQAFKQIEGTLKFATYFDGQDAEEINAFLPQAVSDCCEGLMGKPLYGRDSLYVPDKRKWVKIKKDYLAGVGDTMDLVILAAWNGVGKRTGVYGTFMYFTYDHDNDQYQSVTRIGTGYSDDILAQLKSKLDAHIITDAEENYSYIPDTKQGPPDAWFAPALVAEVKCADLTISSDYMAAHGTVFDASGNDAGIGMRFPRFLRLREDKPPTATTSPEQLRDMYYEQSSVAK